MIPCHTGKAARTCGVCADLPALVCAEPHPIDDATRCQRIHGHDGLHTADGAEPWPDELGESA